MASWRGNHDGERAWFQTLEGVDLEPLIEQALLDE
jgi:hypothetical protein